MGIYKTNYVVKTTELGRKPRGMRGNGVFLGIHKTNSAVKTTELERKPRAGVVESAGYT